MPTSADEIKAFDSAKQDLLDQKMILPFFTRFRKFLGPSKRNSRLSAKSRCRRMSKGRPGSYGLWNGDWLSVRVDGPLWFRVMTSGAKKSGTAQIGKVLESYNATPNCSRHTVQKSGRMRIRLTNKVFLIEYRYAQHLLPWG